MAKESYFLTVRFPAAVVWIEDGDPFFGPPDCPPGSYEEQTHVFYETDSAPVAEALVQQFQHAKPPSGPGLEPLTESPAIFDVVCAGKLGLAQRIDLRTDLDPLERIVSLGDWDPGVWADAGLPHDRRTSVLALYNDQARRWEPLVRDELADDICPPQPMAPPKPNGVHYLFSADPSYSFDDSPRVKPGSGGIIYRVSDADTASLLVRLYARKHSNKPFALVAAAAGGFGEEAYVEIAAQLSRLEQITRNLGTDYHPCDAAIEAMAVCARRLMDLEGLVVAGRSLAATDMYKLQVAGPAGATERTEEGAKATSKGEAEVRKLIGDTLPTAIICAIGIRDLERMARLFPQTTDQQELVSMGSKLLATLEGILHQPGYERFRLVYEQLPEQTSAEQQMEVLFPVLLSWHPAIRLGGTPDEQMASVKATIVRCQELAAEPCQTVMKRIMEIRLDDCRIPHPVGDVTYAEPRRFLLLARKYWGLARQIVVQHLNAYASYQPHPLLHLLVNLRLRLDPCFAALSQQEGMAEAKDIIDRFLDTVTSEDPNILQVVSDVTTSQISQVDAALENLRLRLGTRSYELTAEETEFIQIAQACIEKHGKDLEDGWAKVERRAEAMAAGHRNESEPSLAASPAGGKRPGNHSKVSAPAGHWVGPMTKAEMARLVMGRRNARWRKVQSMFPDGYVEQITEKTFRFRIDHLDQPAQTRCSPKTV
jgi:hypothetical protein